MKKKSKIRAAQFAAQEGIGEEIGPQGEQLFSLLAVTSDTQKLDEVDVPNDEDFEDDEEEVEIKVNEEEEDDYDDEAAQRKYDALMEEYLEQSYQTYLQKKGIKQSTQRKKKRKRLGDEEELDIQDEEKFADELQMLQTDEEVTEFEDDETVLAEPKKEENKLIVKFDESKAGVPRTARAVTTHWFAQDIFKDEALAKIEQQQKTQVCDNLKDEENNDEQKNRVQDSGKDYINGVSQQLGKVQQHQDKKNDELLVAKKKKKGKKVVFNEDLDGDEDDEEGQEKSGLAKAAEALRQQQKEKKGFEVVKQGQVNSDGYQTDSEDEFQALDDQAKAEVLALAKKMLRGRAKTDIIEAAYNRYVFLDEGLPTWFSQDENRHMRPDPQISRADIEAEKARLRAVDARPIKKVAEAKARKKKRLRSRMEKAKKKAEKIVDQEDMPIGSRMREVQRIYNKARKEGGPKKLSKMTRKERRKFLGSRKPMDRRQKSDLRGQKRAEQKLKGTKKKKGLKNSGVSKKSKSGRK
eukprot:TRINITY_DN6402_c0_g1_i2.p1 TRINITY_DN6402_c0_g1~~TRINITY_DN6402_c0_g1_i2.p1  ORF type:complete len:522 (+),score=137.05 TRINITY_DN6402_c0_g1_i2:681-2246(+)